MTIDITSELLAPSSPILKFEAEGDVHRIEIRDIDKQQETSFDDGSPVFWPSGDPKYQYVITGIVEGEEMRLYLKSYAIDALRDAMRAAGVERGESLAGAVLSIKWDSTDEPRRPGMKGARRYKAKLERAQKARVDEDLF